MTSRKWNLKMYATQKVKIENKIKNRTEKENRNMQNKQKMETEN